LTPKVFYLFLAYLSGFLAVIAAMFGRVELLSSVAWILRRIRLSETKKGALRTQEQRILLGMEHQDAYNEDMELSRTDSDGTDAHQPEPLYVVVPTEDSSRDVHVLAPGSPSKFFTWADEFIARRTKDMGFSPERRTSLENNQGISATTRTHRSESTHELMQQLAKEHRWTSQWLRFCLLNIETIVAQPFAYLCKSPDPIALHQAIEYIVNNEVSNHIYVIHFVDDRPTLYAHNQLLSSLPTQSTEIDTKQVDIEMTSYAHSPNQPDLNTVSQRELQGAQWLMAKFSTQDNHSSTVSFSVQNALSALPNQAVQLIRLVNIVDTLYTYKKISCIVVRGMFFCPRAVATISKYLQIGGSNMIMGTKLLLYFPVTSLFIIFIFYFFII
jgi:hypothetical protein